MVLLAGGMTHCCSEVWYGYCASGTSITPERLRQCLDTKLLQPHKPFDIIQWNQLNTKETSFGLMRSAASRQKAYLNAFPDGPCLLHFVVDGVDEQNSLASCKEHQQHKGSQHSLVNAAAAQCKSDIRDCDEARHHVDQAR